MASKELRRRSLIGPIGPIRPMNDFPRFKIVFWNALFGKAVLGALATTLLSNRTKSLKTIADNF